MKLETMSKNIVNVMTTLSGNQMFAKLLYYNQKPYDGAELSPAQITALITPNDPNSKISPFPFDPDAVAKDGVFVRVYYNEADFTSNEVIAESVLHIDVICANSLWLINNGRESLIRPYDIAGRVIDLVGNRSIGTNVKLHFKGLQHLYVNSKYNCIRLYAEYMSVE